MAKKDSIARHHLIIQKLQKKPCSFAEILGHLERLSEMKDSNYRISDRTFARDRNEIFLLYGIDIQYDRNANQYFIADAGKPEISNRMLEAYNTLQALHLSTDLSDIVKTEQRGHRGTEHLIGLIHAIKSKLWIEFEYEKFWGDDTITDCKAAPYLLKEFKHRWYVIAQEDKDQRPKFFALDRMRQLVVGTNNFSPWGSFNAETFFDHCYGIFVPNDARPEEIVLSFTPEQGKYIESLPLHVSQETLCRNETETRIKLLLCPTYDFIMELLSMGGNVKVLSPVWLAEDIAEMLREALRRYAP